MYRVERFLNHGFRFIRDRFVIMVFQIVYEIFVLLCKTINRIGLLFHLRDV